ncbi:hypothetical protein [Desulfosporosinus sp. OT]|uniref:hypothetical protein n=1 Tax=Desulfosporosinus sp. OT TaxID=913865 RepID=UPI000223A284|nr:hypothetical protein [Desulfosporosinus sp. OT]EGW40637.1 hypothetical protein DOT_1384 [Desulfosporosinus sp. OT]
MSNYNLHQWTQKSPYLANWIQQNPPTARCTSQSQPITPNPIFPLTATLPMCPPLELSQTSPSVILVTISTPAETVFTLPTKALEIKTTRKSLKITQCRFYNFLSSVLGIPHDNPKLFLGGFVRKDIQYSEAVRQTANTVEGTIRDFVVNIPISCVVDLGQTLVIPPTLFGLQNGDKLISSDLTEVNIVRQQFLDLLPHCELIFTQISEMDDTLDRVPLQGGPLEEGVFRTIQEKMIILIQLRLTFPNHS